MKPTSSFSEVMKELNELGHHGHGEIVAHDHLRRSIIEAARRLVLLVQTPEEAVRNNAFSPTYNACVRIAIDLDLFRIIASREKIAAADLAIATGAQQELVVRLLRVLCGIGFVTEVGMLCYAPNAVTMNMTIPSTAASIIHLYEPVLRSQKNSNAASFDQGLPSIVNLPRYFRERGYSSPDDYTNGPFQFGHKTDLESYAYWLTQPDVLDNFDTFMNGGKLGNQRQWTEWFPTSATIVDGFRPGPDSVMLVDVAGGRGHDIDAFRRKHEPFEGRLVLEDLPETIEEIGDLNQKIERVGHNFFEKQPIQGARAYFLQDIFHNWPTSVAKLILRNIVEVMTPGYSKLLVSELVLPDRRCPLSMAGLDFGMMYLHSGLERSEQQWRDLFASEGLKVLAVHHEPGGDGAIIECMVDERPLGEITAYGRSHFS